MSLKKSTPLFVLLIIISLNTFSQGIFLGKWGGMYQYENSKGKLETLSRWELVIDRINGQSLSALLYEYGPDDPLKAQKNIIYNKLIPTEKRRVDLEYNPYTQTLSMTGSALYKKDKRQRCNGRYFIQFSGKSQYQDDQLHISFISEPVDCAVKVEMVLNRIEITENHSIKTALQSLPGTWEGAFFRNKPGDSSPYDSAQVSWVIHSVNANDGSITMTERYISKTGKKDTSIQSQVIYPVYDNDGRFLTVDLKLYPTGNDSLSKNCSDAKARLVLYSPAGKWNIEAMPVDQVKECQAVYLKLLKSNSDTNAYFVKQKMVLTKFPATGTYVHVIKEPILGDQVYQFTLKPVNAKRIEMIYATSGRPGCDVDFKVFLDEVEEGRYVMEDKKIPLKFEIIATKDSLIVQNVVSKMEECDLYPEPGGYKKDPNPRNITKPIIQKQPTTTTTTVPQTTTSGTPAIPNGPISANPKVAMLKRWKLVGHSRKDEHEDIQAGWPKGRGREWQFTKDGKFYAYKDGTLQFTGSYTIAPDEKSFVWKVGQGPELPAKILKLTATEMVVEIEEPGLYGEKYVLFFKAR